MELVLVVVPPSTTTADPFVNCIELKDNARGAPMNNLVVFCPLIIHLEVLLLLLLLPKQFNTIFLLVTSIGFVNTMEPGIVVVLGHKKYVVGGGIVVVSFVLLVIVVVVLFMVGAVRNATTNSAAEPIHVIVGIMVGILVGGKDGDFDTGTTTITGAAVMGTEATGLSVVVVVGVVIGVSDEARVHELAVTKARLAVTISR